MEEKLAEIEQKVSRYIQELETHDENDSYEETYDEAVIKQALDELKGRSAKYQAMLSDMEKTGASEIDIRRLLHSGSGIMLLISN